MTILQDNPDESSGRNELIYTPAPLREPRALVATLSFAQRNALIACFNANELKKKDGAWHGLPDGKPTSGTTIADLARDGMLTSDRGRGWARLTEQGKWFARTLLCDAGAARARNR
jgi:hypothetical protein